MSAICGIIGNYARWSSADADLSAMFEALTFRAPDGAATWRDPAGDAMLGFRWLRTRPDQQSLGIATVRGDALAMACDGQVFEDDGARGAAPLLERFDSRGPQGWHDVDAQFALAIWDRERRRLTLARDPLGVRFLYYWRSADGAIFASEIKALLRHSAVTRCHDEIVVLQFLTFLTAPGPRTLFACNRRVSRLHGRARAGRRPLPSAATGTCSMLRSRSGTTRAIMLPARASCTMLPCGGVRVSGPMGALLSGGNDSSANVSLLAQIGPASPFTPLRWASPNSRATRSITTSTMRARSRSRPRRSTTSRCSRRTSSSRRSHRPSTRRTTSCRSPRASSCTMRCAWPRRKACAW